MMTAFLVKKEMRWPVLVTLLVHKIAMVAAAGGFTLYQNENYNGASYLAPKATSGCKNLYPTNNFNDLATSIRFNWAAEPTAARVTFYEHGECLGDVYYNDKGRANVINVGSNWNDKFSSYQWTLNEGGFTLYEHSEYRGASFVSPPAAAGCFNLNTFNDMATSATFYFAAVPSATRITFYEHGNCLGDSWYTQSGGNNEPNFNSYWTDKWSSYRWTLATAVSPPPPSSTNSNPPTTGLVSRSLTNYYFVKEWEYTSTLTAQLVINGGSPITVKKDFKDDVSLEGAGVTNGRVIVNVLNYNVDFFIVNYVYQDTYPFGQGFYGFGNSNNYLKPFVSVAVSGQLAQTYPYGTTLYIRQFAGVRVPKQDGTTDATSIVHDGCVRVDDACGQCTVDGANNVLDFLVVRKQFESVPTFPFRTAPAIDVAKWNCVPKTYW